MAGYGDGKKALDPKQKSKSLSLLTTERPYYESSRKTPKEGWNSMTQVGNGRTFDGLKARPYAFQSGGSPMARAKSGARSISAWQRDYNSKGLCDEKVSTLRFERTLKMKVEAVKEAERRKVSVEAVEEEMYQQQRACSTRIDTGLRKDEMVKASRTYPGANGGPPRLYDGGEKLEEDFDFQDAREMFRGEAWESMGETLRSIDRFKSKGRGLEEANKNLQKSKLRGSFSVGVTPAELAKAQQMSKRKEQQIEETREDIEKIRKHLVRHYGTICAAWRHGLDFDGNGRLTFAEWSKALRQIGYEGCIKATYKLLDEDGSGNVTFDELEPEWAERLKEFNSKVMQHFGLKGRQVEWEAVWSKIDDNGNNQLDKAEFEEVCELIGYSGKPWDLFKEFRFHPSRRFLSLEDFQAMPKVSLS